MRKRVSTNDACKLVPHRSARLAVAGGDHQRASFHSLFSAVRTKLALLVCAHSAYRSSLVFWPKFEAAMAAQLAARIRGWNCLFHGNI
jgi:hypothetical protein